MSEQSYQRMRKLYGEQQASRQAITEQLKLAIHAIKAGNLDAARIATSDAQAGIDLAYEVRGKVIALRQEMGVEGVCLHSTEED